MSFALFLVVVAAAAWYIQGQRRPGAGSPAAAQARSLRTPLVRLADLLGIKTAHGRQANQWAAGAVGSGTRRPASSLLSAKAGQSGRLMHGDRDVSARLDGIRHEARAVSRAANVR
ncbi:hypothetical protein [Streptomyces sp. A1136]|uniref:hypothetical protein n=1 Tax=Streptomyces sp. A1136 TaxID=2563102 RepID=UPI00109E3B6F|nr:hypothetical protein [Streptomyces sp. A1136]THA54276.1 hypothetical protein E6R62_17090 [Streptomyces sp. A1136]